MIKNRQEVALTGARGVILVFLVYLASPILHNGIKE